MKTVSRDPKTGRFVSNSQPKAKRLSNLEKLTLKLKSPLKVFGKKFDHSKATTMPAGSDLVLQNTPDIGPTGSILVRVKKEGSSRTFYTPTENVEEVLG